MKIHMAGKKFDPACRVHQRPHESGIGMCSEGSRWHTPP